MNATFARRARILILTYPLILVFAALSLQLARSGEGERKLFRPGKAIQPPPQPAAPFGLAPASPAPPAPPAPPAQPPHQEPPTPAVPVELQPYAPKGLTIFMMSNRTSEMEPCGCVKNQLGGMQYEATLYESVSHEMSLRVDAGGWTLNQINPESKMETEFILKGMGEALDFDAINVSGQDAGLGTKFFNELKQKFPKTFDRLVSANIMMESDHSVHAFAPYRIVEKKLPDGSTVRVAITGISALHVFSVNVPTMNQASQLPEYNAVDIVNSLGPVIAEVKDKADMIVVLGYGIWGEMVRAAQAHSDIDVIVCSGPTPDYNAKVVAEGPTQLAGAFTNLGKLLGRGDFVRGDQPGVWVPVDKPVWLNVSPKTLKPVQQLVDILGEFKTKTQELFIAVKPNAKVLYAGAQNCAECHDQAYQSWMQSRHAHAMQTLIAKDSQYNPECIKCHVTGFKDENGFYNVRDTHHMANVQCEVCHGPAYEHVTHQRLINNRTVEAMAQDQRDAYLAEAKKLVPPKQVPESTCIKCHQGENDPHFDYGKKIAWVNHQPISQEMYKAKADEEAAAAAAQPH